MTAQLTLARPVRVAGPGLHGGRRAVVTLEPAPAGHGRRFVRAGYGDPVPMTWAHWAPSRMSTTLDGGDGNRLRTVEHLMAALSASGVDNVLVRVAGGAELPIGDGSAAPWCRALRHAGLVPQDASRRALRIRAPVQVARDGGFLRVEPAAAAGLSIDVTHDVLPAFPVMRWRGPVDAATFVAALARSRSFGNIHRRLGLVPPAVPRPPGPVQPNRPDPAGATAEDVWAAIAARPAPDREPLLRGWRPWRAALVAGRHVLPWPRWADEPVRHVALDMLGDLALAGLPILGRVVAHNPSHVKTYALVAALMNRPDCWEVVDAPERGRLYFF